MSFSCTLILSTVRRNTVPRETRPKRCKDREFHRSVKPTSSPVRRSQRPVKEIQREGILRPGNGRVSRVPHGRIRALRDIVRRQEH